MIRRLAAAGLLLAGVACAPGGKYMIRSGYTPPPLAAVLMFDNASNDLDAGDIVRYWFDQGLVNKKGYRTIPLADVDAVLERHGIKDGGQLPSLTPQVLGKELNVPALIYGEVLDFDYQTTGFVNVRKVRARFWMVDAATGERLWEVEGTGANSTAALSTEGALRAGVHALGSQLVDKATSCPLQPEVWDMVWDAIQFLPRGR